MTDLTAITGRGIAAGSTYARLRPGSTSYADQPLRHAIDPALPKASRTGSTYLARCGARVAIVLDGEPFLPDHPRACPKCTTTKGTEP